MKQSAIALICIASACSAAPADRRGTVEIASPVGSGADAQTAGDGQGGGAQNAGSTGADGGASGRPALGCHKMDILFVIDNSGSMDREQANLTANFPKFIEVLNDFQGGELDYRVGVTTTSFPASFLGITVGSAEEGALLRSDGMTKAWLERTDMDVIGTFTKLATVGLGGSGQEQPLRASRSAVTDRVADGSNASFLREDALFALVILTDEDDGSADPGQMSSGLPFPNPGAATKVADFVAAFDAVKGDRARWATAVIAGDQAPECTSQFGSAKHATRLLDFVQQTGENAVFSSICEGDLSISLEDALNTFAVACDNFIVI